MGDSGSRRSTLVSRLPIFRKSISRRHDSLPSSPSSSQTPAAASGGVHSSSPSSTNSSSGSTGKRRSLFRAPSIGFHHKKASSSSSSSSEPKPGLSLTSNGAHPAAGGHVRTPGGEEPMEARGRRPGGLGGSRHHKKITRSRTEDFEREPPSSSSNKSVFIHCLSAGPSEGDDSGFADDPAPRPSKLSATRKLLPKSFSSHSRFSKAGPQTAAAPTSDFSLEIAQPPAPQPGPGSASPAEAGAPEAAGGSSLPSPLLSADLTTTAQTPSEFCTEDSASEADALPKGGCCVASPSDAPCAHQDSTSHPCSAAPAAATRTITDLRPGKCRLEGRWSTDAHPAPDLAAAVQKEAFLHAPAPPGRGPEPPRPAQAPREEDLVVVQNGEPLLRTSSPKPLGWVCDPQKSLAERGKGSHPVSDSRSIPTSGDAQLRHRTPHGCEANAAKVLASSLSPYREGRFVERRLRSSSEGTAGGSRMILKPKDGKTEEANSLRKQRASSSSSKMNSLDVLNNLGSCELDEDDLMLDLEFLEEQHLHPSVCREDSYHSVMSCAAVVLTPMEPMIEVKKREELKFPEPSKQSLSLKLTKDVDQELRCSHTGRIPSSPSVDRPLPSVEENGGIDSLPFRLMLQDCTAVKTLLLKMKRVLQESAELSPANSMASLPVSPLTEEPLPFKDIMKDECSVLKLQLKERDELISQLQEELEKVQHLQKAFASRVDKSTQTELLGCDIPQDSILLNKTFPDKYYSSV
ncbi:serine-rich coiled-coil domain-containing protein 1 isoform X2 [Dipodomys merriami]|uniref:serine-rich coiled-coil domain-containing protein 1 isoform X2 n=1 Tax=Dipodomys merriami TaxID=94247 RepID=UPI003855A25A